MLVNPGTNEFRNCAASGWGWAGTPMALMSHSNCVKSLQSIGFIPVDNITPSILSVKSDPSKSHFFAGQSKETLKLVGKTPFSQNSSKGSRKWAKECYQIKNIEYLDSEIKCYDPVWGDRHVFFKLEKGNNDKSSTIREHDKTTNSKEKESSSNNDEIGTLPVGQIYNKAER